MSEPVQDADAVSKHRLEDATPIVDDAGQTPAAPARPCHVPVLPGYGQAAYKAGCEDEWIDRMSARYGGDW